MLWAAPQPRTQPTLRGGRFHTSQTTTAFLVDHNNPTGYAQTIEQKVDGDIVRSYTIGLDEITQAVTDNPGPAAVISQFLHDGKGSVRQLADAAAELITAATKGMVDVLKLDYDAYGNAINFAATTVATALLFNGEYVDAVTGQQYLRARWYDQATGRFNRVDPFAGAESVPQSLHKYSFGHADPVTHTDPSGNVVWFVPLVAFGIGAAYGTAKGWGLGDILAFGVISAIAAVGIGAAFGYTALAFGINYGFSTGVAATALSFIIGPAVLGLSVMNLHDAYERDDTVDIVFGWLNVGGSVLGTGISIKSAYGLAGAQAMVSKAINAQGSGGFLADSWYGGRINANSDSYVLGSIPKETGGRMPHFFATRDVLRGSRLDSATIYKRVQAYKAELGPREFIGIYKVKHSADVAYSTANANTKSGGGGFPQVYFEKPEEALELVRVVRLNRGGQ